MASLEQYRRVVATIAPDASAREVAEQLRAKALGCLVVSEDEKPIGIVTDRDLLRRVIVKGRVPGTTLARDVMSAPLVSVDDDAPLERVAATMREHAIRRLPVLRDGRLVGIVSLDDLLAALSDEVGNVALGLRRGFRASQGKARARQAARDAESFLREASAEIDRLGKKARKRLLRELEAVRKLLRKR